MRKDSTEASKQQEHRGEKQEQEQTWSVRTKSMGCWEMLVASLEHIITLQLNNSSTTTYLVQLECRAVLEFEEH